MSTPSTNAPPKWEEEFREIRPAVEAAFGCKMPRLEPSHILGGMLAGSIVTLRDQKIINAYPALLPAILRCDLFDLGCPRFKPTYLALSNTRMAMDALVFQHGKADEVLQFISKEMLLCIGKSDRALPRMWLGDPHYALALAVSALRAGVPEITKLQLQSIADKRPGIVVSDLYEKCQKAVSLTPLTLAVDPRFFPADALAKNVATGARGHKLPTLDSQRRTMKWSGGSTAFPPREWRALLILVTAREKKTRPGKHVTSVLVSRLRKRLPSPTWIEGDKNIGWVLRGEFQPPSS